MKTNWTIRVPVWLDNLAARPIILYRRVRYGYAFRRIYLGDGIFTIVDPEDYNKFNNFHWCVKRRGARIYAVRFVSDGAKDSTKILSLHREIANPAKGLLVDHRNGKTLDSRGSNLRQATQAQNSHNCRKQKGCSSKYKGVCFRKKRRQRKLWDSYITVEGKRMSLGCYSTEIEAAKAYDAAAKKYRGEFASLNFPQGDSAPAVLLVKTRRGGKSGL